MKFKKSFFKLGLESLYFSMGYRFLRPFFCGNGVIFTLHHVRRPRSDHFQPNLLLEISPKFLEYTLQHIRSLKFDIVSLDEAWVRLNADDPRKFVCFTFDDAYRDNLEFAYPLMQKYEAPYTLYVPSSFPDKEGELWWVVLERVIAKNSKISATIKNQNYEYYCSTTSEKRETYLKLYVLLRGQEREADMRAAIRKMAEDYNIDIKAICSEFCMGWDEIRKMASSPLCTIGAHTHSHIMLAKWTEEEARADIQLGLDRIKAELDVTPKHFAYPVGQCDAAGPREFKMLAEFGFQTAVTTRPGMLFPEYRDNPMALPRVSINGEYQKERYIDVYLSGAPFMLWNAFTRSAVS